MRFFLSIILIFTLFSLVRSADFGFLKKFPKFVPAPIRPFWGSFGHAAIASVAQTLINQQTFAALQTLLPEVGGQMADVASWADSVRNEPAYVWSKPLHFANTGNWTCNYNRKRDCNDPTYGPLYCVDTAIQNYSARALNAQLGQDQQNEAMKFLIHFVGDVHQPLHCGFIT